MVQDLASIWQLRAEPLPAGALSALFRLMSQHSHPPRDLVVIPAGTDLSRLLQCPFRVRAMTCLRKAIGSGVLGQDEPITVGRLLELEHFGLATLIEVMCIAEAAIDSGFLVTTCSTQPAESSFSKQHSNPLYLVSDDWALTVPLLKKLFTVSMKLHDAQTLSDALETNLGELITELGMATSFGRISLANLVMERTIPAEFLVALAAFWQSLSPREQLIFEHRFVVRNSRTLEDLGSDLSLTRERVRQIQKHIECKWRHPATAGAETRWWLRAAAATIRNDVGPVVGSGLLRERITSALSDVETVAGQDRIRGMAHKMLQEELAYVCSGEECIDQDASSVVEELKRGARLVADDVGLVREDELRARVSEERWLLHWDVLLRWSGLHRIGDRLALRNTKKARVKAALIAIGRPATRQELGELSGVEASRIGSHLSVIPSVVRADKVRWGLEEWVEDEYEGIPAEIIQRIKEEGGATRLERLVEELPRLFGVTESSVRSYVATPRFVLRDGYVSLADESTITLRPLHDAVHGLTADGHPFWRFKVESRYFDGYSLAGLPAEVVQALGCKPDGRTLVSVSSPADCGPVSVGWPLASVAGTYVGYLSAPLRKLGARPGDDALLVVDASRSVSFCLDLAGDDNRANEDAAHVVSPDQGRAILQRMKNRQRGL